MRVVVGPSGQLVIARKGPGRGAWLCREGEAELAELGCVKSAGRRGAFGRALRAEVKPSDVELLLAMASEHARMVPTLGGALVGPATANKEKD